MVHSRSCNQKKGRIQRMKKSKTTVRLLSAILSLAIMIAAFADLSVSVSAKSKWDGYTKISKAADLLKMKNSSDKFYLTKDIDMKGYGDWTEAIRFSGTLDGNGFSIQNLHGTKFGLFYQLTNATVKNLGITNVNLKAKSNSVGALTNGCKNSTIENCYVTGSVESETGHAGGLGGFDSGTVKGGNTLVNCVNMADVSTKKYSAFGIIKTDKGDTLKNCINYGKITGVNAAGGICDRVDTEMIACYNLGQVTATEKTAKVGGIAYYITGSLKSCATVTDSFAASMSASCKATAETNVPKNDFKKAERYEDFDFGKTWTINGKVNNGFPVLTIMLKNYNGSRPTANKPGKTYKESVSVELTTDIENGVVRYTTNGKTPTASSTKYTAPIIVKKNTTIKAVVFVDGVKAKVLTLKYKIQ